jgi:hypothetical protein
MVFIALYIGATLANVVVLLANVWRPYRGAATAG